MFELTLVLNEDNLGLFALQGSNKISKFKVHESLSTLVFLPPNFLMGTSDKKSLIYIWNLSQDSSVHKYVLTGLPLCVTASPCGNYIAVGIDNTIKIWHLSTGQLLNTLSNHYQKISAITWSRDGRLVISGGQDNVVNVWEFHRVIPGKTAVTPRYTFSDHSMPVTDLYCGFGGFKSRLFTSSLDNTCNIYELCSGTLMISLEFPVPIYKILVDQCETCVFGVSISTEIYKVSLTTEPDKDQSKIMSPFINCKDKITCCTLVDADNAILVGTSGTDLLKHSTETGQLLPFSFKSRSPVSEVITVVLGSYKRNDKPVPWPFQRPLQRSNTGLLGECSLVLAPDPQPWELPSDEAFLELVTLAVEEETTGDGVRELKERVSQLEHLSEQVIKFTTKNLLGS